MDENMGLNGRKSSAVLSLVCYPCEDYFYMCGLWSYVNKYL
jgi:hypothetical protein